MMFSGSLTDKVDSVSVELVYTPDETRLDLNGSNADETFQYLTKREGDTSDTTIRLN